MIKYHEQNQLRKERVYLADSSQSMIEGSQGRNIVMHKS